MDELHTRETLVATLRDLLLFKVIWRGFMEELLDYYMNLPYRTIIASDTEEGGFVLCCPELSGCITCAETIAEGYSLLEDAKKAWFLSCLQNGIKIPKPK